MPCELWTLVRGHKNNFVGLLSWRSLTDLFAWNVYNGSFTAVYIPPDADLLLPHWEVEGGAVQNY